MALPPPPLAPPAHPGIAVRRTAPWRRPLTLGVVAAAGTALVGVADPENRHVPLCPFAFLTGLDCPACGSLRAVHALTRFDLADAFGYNALFVVLAPLAVLAWAVWLSRSLGHPVLGDRTWPRWTPWALAAVSAVFAVARNLPPFAALGTT